MPQVWISFAQLELSVSEGGGEAGRARDVYTQAHRALKTADEKEERLMLLEHWKQFEVRTVAAAAAAVAIDPPGVQTGGQVVGLWQSWFGKW